MNPILVPIAAAQGLRTRRHVAELPEAAGARVGAVTRPDATAPPLRVAVLGESTAAGCGAATQDQAFVGSFARLLSARDDRTVEWQVCARNGSTINRLRTELLPSLDGDVDVAVVMIGTNDVMRRTLPSRWRSELTALLDVVNARAGQTIVTGVPPFREFPSLPRTLAHWLGERADRLDAIAAETIAARAGTVWVNTNGLIPPGVPFFASDAFHPSSTGYHLWAEQVVPHVRRP